MRVIFLLTCPEIKLKILKTGVIFSSSLTSLKTEIDSVVSRPIKNSLYLRERPTRLRFSSFSLKRQYTIPPCREVRMSLPLKLKGDGKCEVRSGSIR